MDIYKLVNYTDVWHTEDGWEVNDLHYTDDEIALYGGSKNEIVNQLKNIGYFVHNVQPHMVEVWNDYDMIELYIAETMEPICRLERIQ